MHRVQADESVVSDRERFVGRTQSRLVAPAAGIVMRVVIAYQGVEWHFQLGGDVLKEGPFVIPGMLHIVSGKLDEIGPDQVVDFICHPERNLVIRSIGRFEMKVAGPDKGDRFTVHKRSVFNRRGGVPASLRRLDVSGADETPLCGESNLRRWGETLSSPLFATFAERLVQTFALTGRVQAAADWARVHPHVQMRSESRDIGGQFAMPQIPGERLNRNKPALA